MLQKHCRQFFIFNSKCLMIKGYKAHKANTNNGLYQSSYCYN